MVGSDLTEAKSALNKSGIKFEVIGDGNKITAQVPRGGEKIVLSLGRVLLYTDDSGAEERIKVPSLVGQNATEAINQLISMGFNVSLAGVSDYSRGVGATVIAQSGISEKLPRGSVITLTLRYLDSKE